MIFFTTMQLLKCTIAPATPCILKYRATCTNRHHQRRPNVLICQQLHAAARTGAAQGKFVINKLCF